MVDVTKDREKYIGGSDIAVVMGMSRWKSPLQLWAEKTGAVIPDDISEIEHVKLGTELEDFVAKKFERETGIKVRKAPGYYNYSMYPYMRCQIDRLVTGTDELLECKTAGAWKVKEWEGEEIPTEYILQVMWQLGISGRKVGHIAVLIGGQKFRTKKIDFDEDLFNTMVAKAADFWSMVQSNTPPMAVGLDNGHIVELYPSHGDMIQELQEMNDKIKYMQEIKMHIDSLEEELEGIQAQVKQVIGSNLGINTGDYLVTWKGQKTTRVDSQALKDAGLYGQYSKTSETRVLRVKKDGRS